MSPDAALLQTAASGAGLSPAASARWLWVDVAEQRLYLMQGEECLATYPVSTARLGTGNQQHSEQTPTGLHCIAEKIGQGSAPGTRFEARQDTGECVPVEPAAISTGRDCITSRILWLRGLQPGQRYIYIHGTHEEGLLGQPASIGCVRMANRDVIELFEQVNEGDWVYIQG